MSILTGIFRSSGYHPIAAILSAFQAVVKDFKHRLPLQKADRMVGLLPLWLTSIIPLWPTRREADGESIRRATDTPAPSVQDMGIDHSGRYIGMPEQLLNRPDVVAVLKQLRSNAFKPFDSFEPFESLRAF